MKPYLADDTISSYEVILKTNLSDSDLRRIDCTQLGLPATCNVSTVFNSELMLVSG